MARSAIERRHGREHQRSSGNKRGPGRMQVHGVRVGKTAPARGAGSLDCENEIRAFIHQGKRTEALALYERDRDLNYRAGENRGIQRLAYWYALAKAGDPRAA